MGRAEKSGIRLDEISVGIGAVNEKGYIDVWNSVAEELTGITAKDVIGRPAEEMAVWLKVAPFFLEGKPLFYGWRTIDNIVFTILPRVDDNGCCKGALVAMQELTEHIARIEQNKLMLEAIIDATQDIISVADAQGKIMLVNQAYIKMIGLSKEKVIGQPATIDIDKGESMHLQVMQTMKPVRGISMHVGPQKREVVINAAPFLVQGQLKGSVVVAHDVSEIRHLTNELNKMQSLVRQMQSRYSFEDIVANGPEMKAVVKLARDAASNTATVLLNGESGTGKELFAHAIHHASQRKQGPFIRVNCTAIPESLIESELFGYEPGAFTGASKRGKKGLFEEANQGTLFLDEIGEIPIHVQVKLLRVLQEKEVLRVGGTKTIPVNIRIIAATNRNLLQEVNEGSFREDLYYRIAVFPITIPALRERNEEFPYLVRSLLQKLNGEYGRNVEKVSNEAMAMLLMHNWPGNVRELENVLARSMISMAANETVMQADHLPLLSYRSIPISQPKVSEVEGVISLAAAVEQAERSAIGVALQATHYNKTQAAKVLGITVRNLYYKIEKYQLSH